MPLSSRLYLLLMIWFPAVVAAAPQTQPGELKDLYYGEALYQLYQQHYFQAIVHLLSAQRQGHMQAYGDEPQLLLGGLYLAYGMPDAAEGLFQRLLNDPNRPAIHDQAWLQMAKSRHRRGQEARAAEALAQIGTALTESGQLERLSLEGLVDLERGDNQQALAALEPITDQERWGAYASYNRAIALLRSGQTKAGLEILERLGRQRAEDEEMKALRDRANLVRGYLLLESGQAAQGKTALERVRLSGLATNQALLGVGWASLRLHDPQGALAPWQELAKRDARDPAVLEVLLAIPYALSQLQADSQALDYYQQAIDRYNQEIGRLDQALRGIRQGRLMAALIPDSGKGRQAPAENDITGLLPLLLSKNRFQEHLQDYRDLVALQANLREWVDKIGSYRAMLQVRQAAYQAKLPRVEASLSGQTLASLEDAQAKLQQRFDQAKSPEEPPFILANDKELRLLARFDKIDRLFARIAPYQELPEQHEHARFLRGLLVWRTVTEHPARLWEAEKQLRELARALQQAHQQQAALQRAEHDSKGRVQGFADRIERLERQIPDLLNRVQRTQADQARLLRQMAEQALQGRKSLLHDYLIQARFGVASLLDRSSKTEAGGQ